MRIAIAAASIAFFAASGSAFAADCTKGMLWPYVRNPGDCLTDAELKAGKTGVYSGPVQTNVDVSTIKPDPAVQQQQQQQNTATSGTGTLLGGLLGEDRDPNRSAVACNKGILWPFVRESGDCLTSEEKRFNKSGVYSDGTITQASATAGAAQATPASATASSGTQANPPPPASTTQACSKGWLWPFVRESGDCPTSAEKSENK